MLGYAENDILEKKVKDIVFLNTNPLECSLTGYESKDNASGQYEGYLRTINGKRIPVEFNFSGVKVDKMGFLGTVIVANDVSEILGYIERQKDKNREINITYAELKKKRDFMKRFQKITGERDEQKQKLKRELAGLKIKTVLNGEGEV
ncbi:MAG: hypothetical protein A2231_04850 [Candidatus Firestonebacteria bacterium RIFOXYA2_FULL_40_8]|nr:MAG: hypothetical protein A2231_04850 [Candidatus Firestonebacteria bacterium RIFOXYA2_FULL_40_8]